MSQAKHVVYFAIQPPPEVAAEALERLAPVRGQISGKPSPAGRLHISLNNVGDFKFPPGAIIEKAISTVENTWGRPFVVSLNRMGSWGRGDGQRPIVLWGDEGVIGVNDLYADLHKILAKAEMAPRRITAIEPHMTLAYDGAEIPETFIGPITWRVKDFVLIHAIHGEGRHDVVGRFRLSD